MSNEKLLINNLKSNNSKDMSNNLSCDSCKYRNKGSDGYPCNHCTHNAIDYFKPMTNFERIKTMSIEKLADFICDIYASNEHREIRVDGKWMHPEDVEEWLEREVEDE